MPRGSRLTCMSVLPDGASLAQPAHHRRRRSVGSPCVGCLIPHSSHILLLFRSVVPACDWAQSRHHRRLRRGSSRMPYVWCLMPQSSHIFRFCGDVDEVRRLE